MRVHFGAQCAESMAEESSTTNGVEFKKLFKRKTCTYEDRCERFKVSERVYTRQYSHVYFARLEKMRKAAVSKAEKRWGGWSIMKHGAS